MHFEDLPTPCVLVDLDRMDANVRNMQRIADTCRIDFRPHIKTHKTPAVAQIQLAAGAVGIACAKVAEAEIFAAHGCRDIMIAYPVVGVEKWARVAELARICRVKVGVESEIGARGLCAAAVAAGVTIHVQVEVNTGLNRCGLPPEVDLIEPLCRLVMALPNLELVGITTHRGGFFTNSTDCTLEDLGHEEGAVMVELSNRLRDRGIPIYSVTAGSTPTGAAVAAVGGITEIVAGTYVFGDCMMAELGIIRYDQIALSILCTVVSRPLPGRATVDAGSKTFSGDSYPARRKLVRGFGRAVVIDAYLEALTEEHGIVHLGNVVDPQIGDKVTFFPMHVCTAVNLAEELVGVRDGRVELVWQVLARGKRT